MNKPPVFAAVPNYNMGEYLEDLLPRLKENNYDGIYVMDDASTDNSRDIVHQAKDVIWLSHQPRSNQPLGAAATRNLIIGEVPRRSAIHFIDADTMPDVLNMQDLDSDTLGQGLYPMTAGLVRSKDGRQHVFNHGPILSLRNDLSAAAHVYTYNMAKTNPERAKKIRSRLPRALYAFPDPFTEPKRRIVDWGLESNLIVHADFFSRIGGYDGNLREHEIQELVIRAGKPVHFEPSIALTHREGNVRGYNRNTAMVYNEARIIAKHGLWKWWMFNKRPENRDALPE